MDAVSVGTDGGENPLVQTGLSAKGKVDLEEIIPLPAVAVPVLIGRAGLNIQSIRARSGARISIAEVEDGEELRLIGPEEALTQARSLIMDQLFTFFEASNVEPGTQDKGKGKGRPVPEEEVEPEVTEVMELPTHSLPLIQGNNGSRLLDLQAISGASIAIDESASPHRASISGLLSAVERAKATLAEILENSAEVETPMEVDDIWQAKRIWKITGKGKGASAPDDTMAIPEIATSRFIGKNGQRIREIMQENEVLPPSTPAAEATQTLDVAPESERPEVIREVIRGRKFQGEKAIFYHKCKVEQYADYSQEDGLVQRITIFEDLQQQFPLEMREHFKHRRDKLYERRRRPMQNESVEKFEPGRPNVSTSGPGGGALKEFREVGGRSRELVFYHSRLDNLVKSVELIGKKTLEYFEDGSRQEGLTEATQCELMQRRKEENKIPALRSVQAGKKRNLSDIGREDVLEPTVYDLARERARMETMREGAEEEKQEETASKVDILAPYLVDFVNKDTGIVQLDALQAELVAKKCTQDFRKRLTDRAEIIQRRLEDEQDQLRKKRLALQRRGDNVEKDERDFEKYQSLAMFRTQILEQRLARHEMQAIDKFQELERMLQEDPRLAAMWQKDPTTHGR